MKKLTKKQIETAVEWWGNAITNPKFDNGASDPANLMAAAMARMLKTSISEKKIQAFKAELSKLIKNADHNYHLSCAYGPDVILGKAMKAALIPYSQAPWKTNMDFRDGKVTVSYGYGAERKQLYPEVRESI